MKAAGNTAMVERLRKAMAGPECPALMRHVMRWFYELSNMREWSDGGPKAIKPTEIAAWSSLTGAKLSPREVKQLLDLDVLFRNITAETEEDATRLSEAEQVMLAYANAAKMAAKLG